MNEQNMGYNYPSESVVIAHNRQNQQKLNPQQQLLQQEQMPLPQPPPPALPSQQLYVPNPMDQSSLNMSRISQQNVPNPLLDSRIIDSNNQSSGQKKYNNKIFNNKYNYQQQNSLYNSRNLAQTNNNINNIQVNNVLNIPNINNPNKNVQQQNNYLNNKPNNDKRQNLPNEPNKYPNLLEQSGLGMKESEPSTKDDIKFIYKSQLSHQIDGNPDHSCPYSQGSRYEEEYYLGSYLFIMDIFLDITLVSLFLTILLPCYILTLPTQFKKLPKKQKKICIACEDTIKESEINKTSIPHFLKLFLKICAISIFFVLWHFMKYPFFYLYFEFLKYIFYLIVDFFQYFVSYN